MLSILSSAVLASSPGPYRHTLAGFDFAKLDDPRIQANKYRAGRVFEHYAPDISNLNSVVSDLRSKGNDVVKVSFDEIDFNDGYGAIDVIRAASVEGGGDAWQWLVHGTPSHAPALRVIFPNGNEVFDAGSREFVTWTSFTVSSNTIPSRNQITVQLYKSTGEVFTAASTPNDKSEGIILNYPAGQYKARISTVHEGKVVEDFSDDYFTIRGASPPPPVNNFPFGWLDGITQDGIISGWALDKDRPSESIDVQIYFDGPAGSGTFIASVNANLYRPDVNQAEGVTGNHGYNFPVPDRYKDGQTHTVWVYGIDRDDPSGNSNRQLFGVPKSFRFDKPITNEAPIISSCNPRSSTIRLGERATISYQITDPEGDPFTVEVDWGDGTTTTTESANSASHTYSRTGRFIVKITATDSRGKSSQQTSCGTITVLDPTNRAPVISSCSPASSTVTFGNAAAINFAVSDPDGDPVIVIIFWGDGTTTTTAGSSTSVTHTYASTGTFNVEIVARDGKDETRSSCSSITVITVPGNRPPVISSCMPLSSSVRVGETATLIYTITDPDGDSFTAVVDWGDGQTSVGGPSSASHVYTRAGTFAVKIMATDSRGLPAESPCGSITANPVSNSPPVISSCSSASSSITLGSTATINYAISDPDGDSFTAEIDWGDGSAPTTSSSSSSASHTYSRTGTFTVTITAIDSRGARSQPRSCGAITVTSVPGNNPPVVSSCNAQSSSITVGSTAVINYAISDPDGDTFTVTVDWGDGQTTTEGASSASHIYTRAGTFPITVRATDSRSLTGSRNCGSITVTSGVIPPSPRGAKLIITDVDAEVDGKTDSNLKDNDKIGRDAKPESDVEFQVTVMNNFTSAEGLEIQDVRVKVTIEGIDDGDDLESESREFDLRPQGDKKVTLRFKLPLNVDEGSFDVSIEAEGEDENGNDHKDQIDLELEVEKEKHDLRFIRFILNKQTVKCNESFTASYEIINLGQEDETKAAVEIKSSELGIDAEQRGLSIKSGTEDNTISKSQTLKIGNNAEDGTYTITAEVFSDDGKSGDTRTASLNVRDCPEDEIKPEPTPIPTKTVVRKVPITTATVQVAGIETVQRTLEFPIISLLFKGASGNMLLLVASTFIISIFLLIVAVVFFIRLED